MTTTATPAAPPVPSARAAAAKRVAALDSAATELAEAAAIETAVSELVGTTELAAIDPRHVFGDGPIAAHVEAVATTFKIPATVPTLVALGLRSIGCADRVRLRVRDPGAKGGWFAPPLHLWVLGELHPSIGKSSLFRDLGADSLSGFANRVKSAWTDVVITDKVRRAAASAVAGRRGATEADKKAAARMMVAPPHCIPDPVQDRTTTQDFRGQMLRAGYAFATQAEGSEYFNQFVYETLCVNDVNDGFSGMRGTASTKMERREGNLPTFEEFHCGLVLSPQPGTLSPTKVSHRENLLDAAGRLGHLARFLCARGHEGTLAQSAMTEAERGLASAAYDEDLARFLYVGPPVVVGEGDELPGLERHPLAPRRIAGGDKSQIYGGAYVDADGEAAARLVAYQDEHKARAKELRDAADKRGTKDPRAPLHGRVGEIAMRVAGLLALVREGGVEAVLAHGVVPQVTLDEAERAIYLAETLIPHAEHMLAEAVLGELASLVKRIVMVLATKGRLTEATLWSSHLQHFSEELARSGQLKSSAAAALKKAAQQGWIVEEKGPRKLYYDLSAPARRALQARKEAA